MSTAPLSKRFNFVRILARSFPTVKSSQKKCDFLYILPENKELSRWFCASSRQIVVCRKAMPPLVYKGRVGRGFRSRQMDTIKGPGEFAESLNKGLVPIRIGLYNLTVPTANPSPTPPLQVREGMGWVHDETDKQQFICQNPWRFRFACGTMGKNGGYGGTYGND